MSLHESLRAAWRAVLPGQEGLGASLLRRYAEPHRHYHTAEHVAAMLAWVDAHASGAEDLRAVRLAVWFHDAVYEVAVPDADRAGPSSEERSARLAEAELATARVAEPLVAEVARLVRLTATHRVADSDVNGALLCAADLAILSSPPDRYDRYAAQIRAEYEPVHGVEGFRTGRAAFLRTVLAQPDLAPGARENLARELSGLEAQRRY